MEINAIGKSYQIEIQSHGTLAIIGQAYGRVVFMASGLVLHGGKDIKKFAINPIFHFIPGFGDVVIFEYKLRGELRNPRRLLKSVRNKLMRVIHIAWSEFEQEMCQLDHEMSMAMHHPNRYTKHADKAERRGYESPTDFLRLEEQSTDLDSLMG